MADEEEGRRDGEDMDFDIESIHWSCQLVSFGCLSLGSSFCGPQDAPFPN